VVQCFDFQSMFHHGVGSYTLGQVIELVFHHTLFSNVLVIGETTWSVVQVFVWFDYFCISIGLGQCILCHKLNILQLGDGCIEKF
jgi:hypothetical protein